MRYIEVVVISYARGSMSKRNTENQNEKFYHLYMIMMAKVLSKSQRLR